jgi:hypothetical protein
MEMTDETQPLPAATPDSRSLRARGEVLLRWLMLNFRPPEVWENSRPGGAELWRYATDGDQVPGDGFMRLLARIWIGLMIPVRIALAVLDWALERPARTLVAAGLYILLAHTPYGGWLYLPPWIR